MYTPIMFCNGVMVVALVIPLATLNTGARYFAMMLMPSAAGEWGVCTQRTAHRAATMR
jgi:hypothetical protein